MGNVHLAHRDGSIFDQPDTFMPSRFENKVSRIKKTLKMLMML